MTLSDDEKQKIWEAVVCWTKENEGQMQSTDFCYPKYVGRKDDPPRKYIRAYNDYEHLCLNVAGDKVVDAVRAFDFGERP